MSSKNHATTSESRNRKESGGTREAKRKSNSPSRRRQRTRSRSPRRNHAPGRRFLKNRSPRLSRRERSPRAVTPPRKKPAPVNELDILLSPKNEEGKSKGSAEAVESRSSFLPLQPGRGRLPRSIGVAARVFSGVGGGPGGGFGARQGRDFRRVTMPAIRRGTVGRDFRAARDNAGRTFNQRTEEERRAKEVKQDPNKPVMNLFDPCKVPTGKSYFTHDDRTSKPVRPRASFNNYNRGDETRNGSFAPVGWRNAPIGRDSDRAGRRRDPGGSRSWADDGKRQSFDGYGGARRRETRPSDGVWKHDLFEDDGGNRED